MNYWESERIRLRGLEPADAATFHAWNSDSEMARNLDFLWPPSSLAGVQSWVEERIKKRGRKRRNLLRYRNKIRRFCGHHQQPPL